MTLRRVVRKNNRQFGKATIAGESSPIAPRSLYDEGCIGAHALDVLGERWAILVVRELLYGPKRFSLIRAGLPGISASVLVQRLEGLESWGVVERVRLPEPADVQVYALTATGMAVRPVVIELCRWAVRVPGHDPRKFISPSALMLSMEAMVIAELARDLRVRVALDLGRERFIGRLEAGRWLVERGEGECDLAFAGTPNAMAPVVYGAAPLSHWLERGFAFRGDPALGQMFVDCFSLKPRE